MMSRRFSILVSGLIFLAFFVFGCGDSGEEPQSKYPDAAALLGLTAQSTLEYQIIDSIVTTIPDYSVTIDTSYVILTINPGDDGRVELSAGGAPHDLLRVASNVVLHTAQIFFDGGGEVDTLFFVPTPELMPRSLSPDAQWSYTTPEYTTVSGSERRAFFFLNYGYFTTRTFVGEEEVVVPADAYNAFHFTAELYLSEFGLEPLITADEYYAPDVGVVRIIARSGPSTRIITLINRQ
jgi:hypothetical protein